MNEHQSVSYSSLRLNGEEEDGNYVFKIPQDTIELFLLFKGSFERITIHHNEHKIYDCYREILLYHSSSSRPEIIPITSYLGNINVLPRIISSFPDLKLTVHKPVLECDEPPTLYVVIKSTY